MGDEEEVKKRTKKAKDPEKSKKHRSTKKDKEAGEKSKKRASRREKKIDTGDTADDKKKKRGSRRERKTKLKTEDVSEKEPTKPTTGKFYGILLSIIIHLFIYHFFSFFI